MQTGPARVDRRAATRLAAAVATLIAAGVFVVVNSESSSPLAPHDRHMYSNQTILAEEERSRGQCCVDATHCC